MNNNELYLALLATLEAEEINRILGDMNVDEALDFLEELGHVRAALAYYQDD